MIDNIYIIGHKSPDLDSVAAAISYAEYKNKSEKTDKYKAVTAGNINKETAYVLQRYGQALPEVLKSAEGRKLILVDHNEISQSVDGVERAQVVEILDHHKIDYRSSEPIYISMKPWGSSCSIIADLFFKNNIDLGKELASIMLSAVLVDTVIAKSPTCTERDREIINELAGIAQIEDWQAYGMEIFKVRSDISDLSNREIIESDFKDFDFKQGRFGIGQVETADLSAFGSREDELVEEMKKMMADNDYHSVVLFLTDIINLGSMFLVVTKDKERMEEALGKSLDSNRVYLEGVISRKKQVAPMMMKIFDQ